MHELHSHNVNGKGDADRSPGWRDNYEEIQNFKKDDIAGLVQLAPGRYRKIYGGAKPIGVKLLGGIALEDFDTGAIGSWGQYHSGHTQDGVPVVPQDQAGDACGVSPRSTGIH
jgi:hypothetical protein